MQNNITLIFGRKGSGKTTIAKELIKYEKHKHIIIWDFLGEYENGLIITEEKEFMKYIKTIKAGEQLEAIIRFDKDVYTKFDNLCKKVWKIKNTLLVIEEADSICSSSYIGNGLASLIRYGRHRNIDIIGITRRPSDINRLLTSQADTVCCYKFIEPRDVKYLTDYMQIEPEKIMELKQYQLYQHIF